LRVLLFQLMGDNVHCALNPGERDAFPDSRHYLYGAGGRGSQPERQPHLDLGLWKLELRGHHANNYVALVQDSDGAADYAWVGMKPPPPKPVAEYGGVGRIEFAVGVHECATNSAQTPKRENSPAEVRRAKT
jgi:hypothetical protein